MTWSLPDRTKRGSRRYEGPRRRTSGQVQPGGTGEFDGDAEPTTVGEGTA